MTEASHYSDHALLLIRCNAQVRLVLWLELGLESWCGMSPAERDLRLVYHKRKGDQFINGWSPSEKILASPAGFEPTLLAWKASVLDQTRRWGRYRNFEMDSRKMVTVEVIPNEIRSAVTGVNFTGQAPRMRSKGVDFIWWAVRESNSRPTD